jgi:hypothetical protein
MDGSVDGYIATFIQNWGPTKIPAECHADSGFDIPNTHLRGIAQIDFVLATDGIKPFIDASVDKYKHCRSNIEVECVLRYCDSRGQFWHILASPWSRVQTPP